jgi:hypothetical protein
VNHWGQRKLLLSEIEFLTDWAPLDRDSIVVYAGAAPGTHIAFLAEMFPRLSFVLVDPSEFKVHGSGEGGSFVDLLSFFLWSCLLAVDYLRSRFSSLHHVSVPHCSR